MSRIRGKNTTPELLVFRYLTREGIHFQKHYKRAPGCPDVAVPSKKKAVIIDGDFWHGWKFGATKKRLKGNKYWIKKIELNMKRDQKNRRLLRKGGWQVIRVWEHQLKDRPTATLLRVREFLSEKQK